MTDIVLLDAIGRTADILAEIETSIMEVDRPTIETLTFDLHAVLSGLHGCVPNSEEERLCAEKVFATTLRLEKLLADRMTTNDSAGIRRKPKHKPGLVSYYQ